jgi:hypothetical protein
VAGQFSTVFFRTWSKNLSLVPVSEAHYHLVNRGGIRFGCPELRVWVRASTNRIRLDSARQSARKMDAKGRTILRRDVISCRRVGDAPIQLSDSYLGAN